MIAGEVHEVELLALGDEMDVSLAVGLSDTAAQAERRAVSLVSQPSASMPVKSKATPLPG